MVKVVLIVAVNYSNSSSSISKSISRLAQQQYVWIVFEKCCVRILDAWRHSVSHREHTVDLPLTLTAALPLASSWQTETELAEGQFVSPVKSISDNETKTLLNDRLRIDAANISTELHCSYFVGFLVKCVSSWDFEPNDVTFGLLISVNLQR
jgi:hypothetical protein